MGNDLKFYKVRAKVGHAGAGEYGDMNVYVSAYSLTEAIKIVKHLPKVKHTSSLPVTSAVEVGEEEFVVLGLMKNAYSETAFSYADDVIKIRPLDSILGDVNRVFRKLEPTTSQGKKLVWFAKKYNEAESKKAKKNLLYSYIAWAEQAVEEYTQENENI